MICMVFIVVLNVPFTSVPPYEDKMLAFTKIKIATVARMQCAISSFNRTKDCCSLVPFKEK